MIAAPLGWVVKYGEAQSSLIAWDDNGGPLVVDKETGRLVPADQLGEVVGAWQPESFVEIAPSGGWLVACVDAGDGDRAEPLVGWGLKSWGEVVPLVTNPDGLVVEVAVANEETGHPHRVFHPESTGAS